MTMLSHEMPAQRFAEIEPLRVFHTLKIWHDRSLQRSALSGMTELELADIGLSPGAMLAEIDKPFWRA